MNGILELPTGLHEEILCVSDNFWKLLHSLLFCAILFSNFNEPYTLLKNFLIIVQGSPKSVKTDLFCAEFRPDFSEYFDLISLYE